MDLLADKPGVIKIRIARVIAEVLFANYQCKVIFPTGEYGIFGYGSLSYARFPFNFGDNTAKGAAMKVGNYCDIARSANFMLGGEHHNDSVINLNLIFFQNLRQKTLARNVVHHVSYSNGPINIGSNVCVSQSAFVKSGVTIGNGAVIGARAVVTKDVPDFAIVGGSPAKVLKYRFSETVIDKLTKSKWWDMHPTQLSENIENVQKINADSNDEIPSFPRNNINQNKFIVFKSSQIMKQPDTFVSFEGVEIDNKFIAKNSLPPIFQTYGNQLDLPAASEFYVADDIFALSGL